MRRVEAIQLSPNNYSIFVYTDAQEYNKLTDVELETEEE